MSTDLSAYDVRPFLAHPHLLPHALPGCGDALLIAPDDLDAAVIGLQPTPAGPVFVYDADRLVELLIPMVGLDDLDEDDDPDDQENSPEGRAWLHLHEAILGSHDLQGPRAPFVLRRISDENPLGDDEVPMDFAGASWSVLAAPKP
jgi:hypothetical protein